MLRKLLGDSVFWPAVTDYLKTYQGKVAETNDFQRKLEEHSGLNLQRFFDQWYYSKGFPILKISYTYDTKNKLVELKIKQTQVDKDKQIGLFEFNLEIKLEYEESKFSDFTFKIVNEEHVFYVKSASEPKQIVVDRDNKILMDYDFNPGTEMLKRIYKFGSIKNKIKSANELAKEGSILNIVFLAEQYSAENFWGLKIELLDALSNIYSNEVTTKYLSFLETEKNPLIIKEILKKLQNQPPVEQVLLKTKDFLNSNDTLYFAFLNGFQILGSFRSQTNEVFEYLKNYQIKQDQKGLVLYGKRLAIGKLRTPEAIDYLLNEIQTQKHSESDLARLIEALGESITWANDKSKEIVKEILINKIKTENNLRVLRAVGNALAKYNDPSLNQYLQKMKTKFAFQDHPMIDKLIEQNKAKTQNEEFKKLEERLTKIEKENLDLKDKVLKLEGILEK